MKVSRSILLLALAYVSSSALAADAESAVPDSAVFVTQAAQAGLSDIEAAKVALARSTDPKVRSFAQLMVKDHGQTNIDLAALALAKGIDAPSELDSEHQSMLDELTSTKGPDFDRTYAEKMNNGRIRAVALFEAATNSPDPQVSGFAKKALPKLREQKQLAEKLPDTP